VAVQTSTHPRLASRARHLSEDPVVRTRAVEVISTIAIVGLVGYLGMRALEQEMSFRFLTKAAGFGIGDQFLTRVRGTDPQWLVFVAGIANTIRVAIFAILLATLLGIVIGVARLSNNWLISRIATVYVETIRNMPLLVFVVFWYTAVVLRLPRISEGYHIFGFAYLSNRALAFASLSPQDGAALFALAALVAIAAGGVVWYLLAGHERERGGAMHASWWGLGIALGGTAVAFVATGLPLRPNLPEAGRFAYTGGLQLSPEFAGLLLGVGLYRAAFVGEVVRGGLQAVPRGQREAAAALGLSGWQSLTQIVLPQTLRLIIPSMVGQSQVLVKSTAVAVAIAYPDMLSIGRTIISNAGEAEAMFLVIMASYLTINLLLSFVLGRVRRRWPAAI
jgi:general L-amino acid transport system permease protein